MWIRINKDKRQKTKDKRQKEKDKRGRRLKKVEEG
jgi:hypothetical protein